MTKAVWVKNIKIGGGAKISVQTMTNTPTSDVDATIAQILRVKNAGCDIVRVSVPDIASAKALKSIIAATEMPIIADIHYDYKMAIKAIEYGAHKIRINPSNIPKNTLKDIAKAAKEHKIPIRVGVNQGSVGHDVLPLELASFAIDSAKILEDEDFTDIVLAVKSSNVLTTVGAYRALSRMTQYPLHIGLTESGTSGYGAVKSSVAIGSLLLDGIGDTLRVSLADDIVEEVALGKKILRAVGVEKNFVEVIACPTCARTVIPVESLAKELERRTQFINKPIKIAVMGCAVNGIGESQGADFGVCGGKDISSIFLRGKMIGTVKNEQILETLLNILEGYNDN